VEQRSQVLDVMDAMDAIHVDVDVDRSCEHYSVLVTA